MKWTKTDLRNLIYHGFYKTFCFENNPLYNIIMHNYCRWRLECLPSKSPWQLSFNTNDYEIVSPVYLPYMDINFVDFILTLLCDIFILKFSFIKIVPMGEPRKMIIAKFFPKLPSWNMWPSKITIYGIVLTILPSKPLHYIQQQQVMLL